MASRRSPQKVSKPRISLWLLTLVVSLLTMSVTDSADPIQLEGEVGGNVTFRCPADKNKAIHSFYFQTSTAFVNGFHVTKPLKDKWANTSVDGTNVIMYNLSISSSGTYKCLIMYTVSQPRPEETIIELSVTAKYTKPEVTVVCTDDNRACLARCEARGGNPATKIMWNAAGIWEVLNNNELDPHTMSYNSVSTANFSCSSGPLHSLSCSVGNLTSELFSVCTPKDPPGTDIPSNVVLISAVVICAVVFICSMAALLYCQCRKGERAADAQRELGEQKAEESIALSQKGGEEAS